jgi:uncharacterized membrane protein
MTRASQPRPRPPVSTEQGGLDRLLSWVLFAGLGIALALMLAGILLALLDDGQPVPPRTTFAGLLESLVSFEAEGLFGLGLLVLLATPAVRVLASILFLSRRRQWRFVFIGMSVLAVLALSVFFGLHV